jgi:ribosomal protein L13
MTRRATLSNLCAGKHKPTYDRAKLNGDIVVVSNVDKIMFTGNKMTDKECADPPSCTEIM